MNYSPSVLVPDLTIGSPTAVLGDSVVEVGIALVAIAALGAVLHLVARRAGSGQFSGLHWGKGLLTGVVTMAIVSLVMVPLGFIAKALQGPVDDHFFDYIEKAGTNSWTDVLETTTQMGNVMQTQRLGLVLSLVLAVGFAIKGYRWWVPIVLFPVAWWIARLAQLVIAAIIDRNRDALSLVDTKIGAYPSGGCARIILMTGTAVVLIAYYGKLSRKVTQWLLTIPLAFGLAEAYFRARLNQHWLTDVVGGVVFGGLLLAALYTTLKAFDPDPGGSEGGRRTTPDPVDAAA